MAVNWRVAMRKAHRWGAILVALPFLLVIVTGILLQLKKELPWVQPPTQRRPGEGPGDLVRRDSGSGPRPSGGGHSRVGRRGPDRRATVARGLAKVTSKSRWEVQVDLKTGGVLQAAYRRSDLIESLHDGSWFHDSAKLYVLPAGVVVLGLWFTGIYLFVLPIAVRWRRKAVTAAPPPSRSACFVA